MSGRTVINIDSTHNNNLVVELDKNNFFRLNNPNCPRKELFNFALALGYKRGYATEVEKRTSLFRTENLANDRYLYQSIFFTENIATELCTIDTIIDENEVFNLAEKYVNTGLSVIKEKLSSINEEDMMYELLNEMDDIYSEIEKDFEYSIEKEVSA